MKYTPCDIAGNKVKLMACGAGLVGQYNARSSVAVLTVAMVDASTNSWQRSKAGHLNEIAGRTGTMNTFVLLLPWQGSNGDTTSALWGKKLEPGT